MTVEETVFKQFRIKKSLLEKFNRICEKKDINASKWLRSRIEEFVKENEK